MIKQMIFFDRQPQIAMFGKKIAEYSDKIFERLRRRFMMLRI